MERLLGMGRRALACFSFATRAWRPRSAAVVMGRVKSGFADVVGSRRFGSNRQRSAQRPEARPSSASMRSCAWISSWERNSRQSGGRQELRRRIAGFRRSRADARLVVWSDLLFLAQRGLLQAARSDAAASGEPRGSPDLIGIQKPESRAGRP